jgi:NAD(P)-dependent dehydrogenase (short-subunit alcohol dehydrogenase family)
VEGGGDEDGDPIRGQRGEEGSEHAWRVKSVGCVAAVEGGPALGHHYTLLAGTSWLDPQDIANAAPYLNSDLASKVTGITLPVDAGHLTLSGYNPASTR